MSVTRAGSAAALAVCLAALGCMDRHPQPVQLPPAIVQVAVPLQKDVTDYDVFTARTQAVQSVDLKARVTGYLTRICFKDGDLVEQGQVLFEIDDRPYKAAFDKAQADVDYNKASLVKAQAEYDIVLKVQQGDKAAISAAEIAKKLGDRDQAAAAVKQAEAVRENAKLNYDWCKVEAPISGRANRHFVDVGNLVTQDTTLLTNIVSLKPIWAYFQVDENTAQRYQRLVAQGKIESPRKTVLPVTMALGSGTDFSFTGSIDFLSNQFDPNTGTITVRAVFPNDDQRLSGGEFGRIRVPASARHPALLVADQAIGIDQGQKFVLVVNDRNEVEYRAVQTGQLHDGFREVLRYRTVTKTGADGKDVTEELEVLKPTDRLIVNGLQRVRPGMTVVPRTVEMASLVAGTSGAAVPVKK